MKAMILAAGFGTRLWPLTIGRTKPAIPFLNRPLIAFTVDYLKKYGFDEVIINLHHEPESVRAQLGDGSQFGIRIRYAVEEPEILGTSGALDNVREQLEHDTFIVVNGKIITDIDLKAALQTHREHQALATLVLRPNPKHERFSEIHLTADGRLEKFGGFPKPVASDAQSTVAPLMFTGIHLMEPQIFDYIPRGVFSDSVRDVYPKAMADGKFIAGHIAQNSAWYELSTLERYWAISQDFLQRVGQDVVMNEGCVIEPTAQVTNSILWQRVQVQAGARVTDCIIGDDVVIPANSSFHRATIVRAALTADHPAPEKANQGTIMGDNLVVPF